MSKEVTTTTVTVAELIMENGSPVAVELPNETLLGNVSLANAQKALNQKYGRPVTIFEVQPETHVYEMPVEEFIQLATIKEK